MVGHPRVARGPVRCSWVAWHRGTCQGHQGAAWAQGTHGKVSRCQGTCQEPKRLSQRQGRTPGCHHPTGGARNPQGCHGPKEHIPWFHNPKGRTPGCHHPTGHARNPEGCHGPKGHIPGRHHPKEHTPGCHSPRGHSRSVKGTSQPQGTHPRVPQGNVPVSQPQKVPELQGLWHCPQRGHHRARQDPSRRVTSPRDNPGAVTGPPKGCPRPCCHPVSPPRRTRSCPQSQDPAPWARPIGAPAPRPPGAAR